jgi:uncharacterized membrane protein YfcA
VNVADVLLIAVAGCACGVVNSIAGGGSLILFPALLLTGISPLSANVTNSVATWAGYVGGVGGFREELADQRHRLPRLVVATVLGSTTGCVLLLTTPSKAFDVVVPWLILAATILTAIQPAVRRRVLRGGAVPRHRPGTAAVGGVFLATIYGGYFGGALGVIVLAVLGLTLHESIRELNATKAVLSVVDATVSVVVFGLFGPVQWVMVLVAAPTTLLGGYLGARFARRLDERVLRAVVVALGFGVTVALLAT